MSIAAARKQPETQKHWTDERLVAECRKGNQEAWSALLEKYKNLIFSIPIKLGLYQEAADIFQSVCLDLLTDLPKLREPRALAKWLMQTCYHKCLRHKHSSQAEVPIDDQSENFPAANVELPEDLFLQLEREQMLRNAISKLPPRCANLIRMLFFETPPRPYNLIAEDLNLASGSIGFIRGRCLAKLRRELEKRGF